MILPKISVSASIFLLIISFTELKSENILSVSDTSVNTNQNFYLSININNSDSIIGYQFDVIFPTTISYLDSFLISIRHQDHQVVVQQLDSTRLRALCFSPSNQILMDSSGFILKLLMHSKNRSGQYPIVLENATLVGPNNTNVLDSVQNGLLIINPVVKINSGNKIENPAHIYIYPNPFNNSATIKYYLQQAAPVKMLLINSLGQTVKQSIHKPENKGWNTISLQVTDLPSGFYLIRILSAEKIYHIKTMILK